jgi:hypothetical protein
MWNSNGKHMTARQMGTDMRAATITLVNISYHPLRKLPSHDISGWSIRYDTAVFRISYLIIIHLSHDPLDQEIHPANDTARHKGSFGSKEALLENEYM